jgi:dTDP-4-dehydrorhamnose 3,5-epimerase
VRVVKTEIPEVLIIEPQVFGDDRGFFQESFNQKKWQEATGLNSNFVQDNHSRSTRGVLRGLHYQLPPFAQGKLVRCVVGEVFDVAVDIRRASSSYGQWVGIHLNSENKKQLWIPGGFAHGFLVLSDVAEFLYKTTDYYVPEYERSICWNDATLGIEWPDCGQVILSSKDRDAPSFMDEQRF